MRIGVDNAGRECLRVQKSVELCEKVWNFSIASHTTSPRNLIYSDSTLGPHSSEPFGTILPPWTTIKPALKTVKQCIYGGPAA